MEIPKPTTPTRRTEKIMTTLLPSEFEAVTQAAREHGISKSSLVRYALAKAGLFTIEDAVAA